MFDLILILSFSHCLIVCFVLSMRLPVQILSDTKDVSVLSYFVSWKARQERKMKVLLVSCHRTDTRLVKQKAHVKELNVVISFVTARG